MTPIAHVGIPAWGSRRTPVLAIDGDTWTVQGPHTRLYPTGRRKLKAAALDLRTLCPTRVGLVARRAGHTRRTPPIPDGVKGAEWMEARARRLAQLHVCVDKGWLVQADEADASREAA